MIKALMALSFPIGKENMLTPLEIGRMIRETRRNAGLRQDELAAVAGVGLRFVVELEQGKASAHLGKTLQVLDALGLDLGLRPRDDAAGWSS